ncbi:MAG: VanZ family protein [Bacteroidales bacterium]|nr:VanZ family protein [Bacteroidales bacterium]
MKYQKVFRIFFWVWSTIVFVLSVWPNTPKQEIRVFGSPFRIDYYEHFFVFAFLGVLFILQRKQIIRPDVIIVLALLGFAILTESLQLFIPGRFFNPYDLAYNILGLMAGGYLMYLMVLKKMKLKEINNYKNQL